MEPVGDDPSRKEDNVEEANDLLEECWFFDNLLNRKQKMLRCLSDPHSNSSDFGQEMSVKMNKAKEGGGFSGPNLVRTPSLPLHIGRQENVQVKQSGGKSGVRKLTRQTSHQKMLQTTTSQPPVCIGRRTEGVQDKESDIRRSKVNGQPVRHNLLRTPSLPPCLGREERNQESVPQRHKGLMTQCSSIPRYRPSKTTEGESNMISTNGIKEMRRRCPNQLTTRKSLSDLEIEELQGFKDLGFTFDKEELTPSVVNILPGLQDKKRSEDLNPAHVRRPYLSEVWLAQSSAAPPPPNLGATQSAEDMKAQIKFWARSVASNVR
ncbi:uncharacterized protein LOC126615323 [Malus sylvestris]|uniref:uncharacterized protein LOC126615323 n=1 Tax=Malus sylvestris TaxID=3752 RepID=UPI0021ACC4C2|nr:uncharacterized protein LOC126615323 [Malus sylvestris]